eukprot:CAMPEP_0170233528 /NCGR_PEP_ID=MMETSP0116_2-20130129/16510_1 /TAXON_ID=400756 /ORGANISM="Durinskia baltica, Strain CSIRO CS-38" /LENGTH=201 /DNA_ID=CAMNT_0010484323 /DNA_START=211 /DNA_END=816 /DNA_ORIENTATION=+
MLYGLKLPGWEKEDMVRDLSFIKGEAVQPDGTSVSRDPGYHYEELSGSSLRQYGIWDVPGSEGLIRLWPKFYRFIRISAVIFVVDHFSPLRHNFERIRRTRDLIRTLLNEDELRACCFWVVLNVGYSKNEVPSEAEAELERATLEMLGVSEIASEAPHDGRFFEASINCAEISRSDPQWERILKEIRRVHFRIGEGSGRLD